MKASMLNSILIIILVIAGIVVFVKTRKVENTQTARESAV